MAGDLVVGWDVTGATVMVSGVPGEFVGFPVAGSNVVGDLVVG